jgi:hypothetical protein
VRFAPDQTLPDGSQYTATVNPDSAAAPAVVDGFRVPPATSNAISADSAVVSLRLAGGHGARQVKVKGPFVVIPSAPLTNVTASNVVVRPVGSSTPVDGKTVCRDVGGHAVSCVDGPVSSVRIKPSRALIPGASFVAKLNPAGADPARRAGVSVAPTETGPVQAQKRLDQSSPVIHYRWGSVTKTGALGGRFSVESARGARASYDFHGRRVQWLSVTGPDRGLATVRVDGKLVDQVDEFSRQLRFGVRHTYRNLGRGRHTIVITASGKHGAHGMAGRAGNVIGIDAFKVWARSGATLVPNPKLTSRWGPLHNAHASGQAFVASSYRGAALKLRFDGTGIKLLTFFNRHGGKARVLIDGSRVRTIRTLGHSRFKALTFRHLRDGVHRLQIVVRGSGSTAVDGFKVMGRP